MAIVCSVISSLWNSRRFALGWSAPLIWSPLLLYSTKEMNCAYVALIMITYWFLEIIPISATALVPLVLFPMVGVMSSNDVCRCYFNVTLMVFLGSLIAATAVESSSLHIRTALKVIIIFGTSPRNLLLGFMLTTGFFSLFISNVAAVALMLPIVHAAMDQLANRGKTDWGKQTVKKDDKIPVKTIDKGGFVSKSPERSHRMSEAEVEKFRKGLLLGVCYASNIGGTGTLTGTASNLVLNYNLDTESQISYSQWLIFNFPSVWICIVLTWAFLCVYFLDMNAYEGQKEKEKEVWERTKNQYRDLGTVTFPEKAVFVLFSLMLLLWFFRDPDFMPGWTAAFTGDESYIEDQVPGLFVTILFFMIPRDPWDLKNSKPLLNWKTAEAKVSWGVMILIGGGFALAKGCETSGLSLMISDLFHSIFEALPVPLMCFLLLMTAAMITECTSNAATVTVLLPIVKPIAARMHIDPVYLMLPMTVSCSYATMLPIASGTNAIVFDIAQMKNIDMIVPGFIVKLLCVSVLYITVHTWGVIVFGFK